MKSRIHVRPDSSDPQGARYTERLELLLKIAEDLTQAMTDPERVLQATLERTADLFDVTRATLVRYEGDGYQVVAAFDRRTTHPLSAVSTRLSDSPLQAEVRQSQRPIIVADGPSDTRLSALERETYLRLGIKTLMLVPLIARGRTFGRIDLAETLRPRVFSSQEQELAQILADLAAIAIDNARLYGLAETELNAIITVGQNLLRQALKQDITLSEFFQFVLNETLNLLKFNTGWLLLQEGEWLRIVAADEEHREDVGRAFPLTDSVSGLSVLDGKPVRLLDLDNMEERYSRIYKFPHGPRRMRSELVTPLMASGHAIGAFNLESEEAGAFTARHEDMMMLLGDQVALAIELVRERERTRRLSDASLKLSLETQMDLVVKSILLNALDFIGGRFGQVLLQEQNDLVVHYTTNDPPSDMKLHVAIDDSVSGLAILERQPVIVPEVDSIDYCVVHLDHGAELMVKKQMPQPLYKRALETEKERMQAEYVELLRSNGKVLGAVNLETPDPSGFSIEQRVSVTGFIRANEEAFTEAILHRDHRPLQPLLQQALARAATNFGQVLRYEPETNEVIIVQTSGDEPIGTRVTARSVTGRAIRNGTREYVQDVNTDPDYKRYLGQEMKSELVVPITLADHLIGVLNLESPVPRFFTRDHAEILSTFAAQAAVAIDRARRFESQQLAEIGGVAGDVVHRLNNPLGAISTRLELLQAKDFYPDLIQAYPYLGQFVERTARDIASAKNTVQELRSIGKGRTLKPVALHPSIAAAVTQADLPKDIQVHVEPFEADLKVMANDRLSSVFWNLLDNARKFMPQGGSVTVSAKYNAEEAYVVIRVKDTGLGIEPWRWKAIFDLDESTTPDAHAPAHGLGLYWAKAQIVSLGGSIEVESSELGVGTCMLIRLPKAS